MPIRDYPMLLKEKGPGYLVKRIYRAMIGRIWERTECELLTWTLPPYSSILPEGFDIEFRSVSKAEARTLIDPEIAIPPAILEERFSKDMRMYGVMFDGKVTEYVWAAGPPIYRETSCGFSMALEDDEIYYFDYKGIIRKRPDAFRHFILMKAFTNFCMVMEQERTGIKTKFYSLVSTKNKISMKFHYEHLNATCCDRVVQYRFLFIKWARSRRFGLMN